MKGSKTKQVPDIETEDSKESIGELSTIFSTENFPSNIENKDYTDEELELNIGISCEQQIQLSGYPVFWTDAYYNSQPHVLDLYTFLCSSMQR